MGLLTPAIVASNVPPGRDPGGPSRLLRVEFDARPDGALADEVGAEGLAMQLDVNVIGRPRADPADAGADDGRSGFGAGALVAVVLGAAVIGIVAGAAARARRARGGS